MPTNDEIEAETYRVAKRNKCDKGTFTVCWGEYERGEVCRCKEEARAALTAAERVRVVVANEEKSNANGHEVNVVWQTIDSAPKDGTLVLATWQGSWPDYPHIEVVYFDGGYWHYAYDGDGPSAAPTHWMPCPDAPSERVRSLNAEQRHLPGADGGMPPKNWR